VVPLALILAVGAGAAVAIALHGATPRQSLDAQRVYNRLEPSIVDVTSSLPYAAETAEGTGFVIDAAQGLVLTNNHVIDGATSVSATIVTSGRTYPATVIGDNAGDDVALLRLRGATGLVAASLGSASDAAPGDPVLGIGNSGGQGGPPTVVPGHVSSLGRTIKAVDQSSGFTEILRDMLQVAGDIQPGDSGGPLADAAGQVIGMDTAASRPSARAAAESFAIPIGIALADARQIGTGRTGAGVTIGRPAFLGAVVTDRSATDPSDQFISYSETGGAVSPCLTTLQEAGIPARVATARSGILVEGVLCGTPADTAGLGAGDVITAVAGRTVSSVRALSGVMTGLSPGQRVPVRWVAVGGAGRSATVRLGEGPAR